MTDTTRAIVETAKTMGGHSADAYWDEFEEMPELLAAGDWDSSAWQTAWHELKDAGATDADYAACLDAWRLGFFGGSE